MRNMLGLLVGRKIVRAEKVHDYLQLWFDNGALLNIFNLFTVSNGLAEGYSLLIECEISSVGVSDEAVEFAFMDGKCLHVGMADSDYQGPEAMEYVGVNGERIVWP
jgi:hypothetical protein